jgi:hypothetical protein
MFCESCGTELNAGQTVCAKCGRALVGYAAVKQDRMARHVQLLGIFWVTYSVLHLIGGIILLILANTLIVHLGQMERGVEFLHPLLSVVAVLLMVKGAVGVAAGYGLVERAGWARIFCIVLGFLALLSVPFGTALGVYTIWVLLPPGADEEYRGLGTRRA